LRYELTITQPRPYFAEVPYAVWGEVNYNSEGNCRRPTDRQWTELYLDHRQTREALQIVGHGKEFIVESATGALAARAAQFLVERVSARLTGADPQPQVGSWTYEAVFRMTARIRAEFPREELAPFDIWPFWGSWKWVGWFGTEYTWVGRWIMNSLLVRDTRAVNLCVEWLRAGTYHPDQSVALRHGLRLLTNQAFLSDADWVAWYDDTGHKRYPKPDFGAWLVDLKRL
jgi:hypothetical protein